MFRLFISMSVVVTLMFFQVFFASWCMYSIATLLRWRKSTTSLWLTSASLLVGIMLSTFTLWITWANLGYILFWLLGIL
jgi:hypothetical protein